MSVTLTAFPVRFEPPQDLETLVRVALRAGFPDARPRIDPTFLRFLKGATFVSREGKIPYRIVTGDVYSVTKTVLNEDPLSGQVALSMVLHFGQGHEALQIDGADAPLLHRQEFERNLLLGAAIIDNLPHWLYIEHEWENTHGRVEKEVHLHAARCDNHRFNENDHLSAVSLSA